VPEKNSLGDFMGEIVKAIRLMIIGFWLSVGWAIAQWLMSISIPFWVSKIQAVTIVRGIPF
jgi:uncharacterized membrane protein YccF (DUF307 family)